MAEKTGTTTIGLVYKDGVVLAADRRVSLDHIVAHPNGQKIFPVTKNIGITTAGLVSDLQVLVKLIQAETRLFTIRSGSEMTTESVVGLLSSMLYEKRLSLNILYAELIVGGYDTKPRLFVIDEVGSYTEDKYAFTGSGGVFALGVLQADYKDNMSEEEAIRLAHKAVSSSLQRDVYTGNGIDIVVINKKGYNKLTDEEINKIISK
ncbi:MAG: proteasome subunit beta [Nanoarchaeota archaeon]|nr:proteasome subunit beta [Nanoarchaeota archaeon]